MLYLIDEGIRFDASLTGIPAVKTLQEGGGQANVTILERV